MYILKQAIIAILAAFIIQTAVIQPFKIPSSSMKPGIQISDYIIVNKFSYSYNNNSLAFKLNSKQIFNRFFFFKYPKRGDIVVFILPTNRKVHYIKRVIGLPGEKIQIKNSIIYINNKPLIRKESRMYYNNNYKKEIYKEYLFNKKSYFVNKSQENKKYSDTFDQNNTFEYNIPKEHFFLMGDNRNNSIDSRFLSKVGYINFNHIVGKAKMIFWGRDYVLIKTFRSIANARIIRDIK